MTDPGDAAAHPAHHDDDTNIHPLGTMTYTGPVTYLRGRHVHLCHYHGLWGPSVAAHWNGHQGPGMIENTVAGEDEAVDPHLIEAFRRARRRGLVR